MCKNECSMEATLTKLGEGAFADVFGCQKEGWDKLAVKVGIFTADTTMHPMLDNVVQAQDLCQSCGWHWSVGGQNHAGCMSF